VRIDRIHWTPLPLSLKIGDILIIEPMKSKAGNLGPLHVVMHALIHFSSPRTAGVPWASTGLIRAWDRRLRGTVRRTESAGG
jgi:hypothetical protein